MCHQLGATLSLQILLLEARFSSTEVTDRPVPVSPPRYLTNLFRAHTIRPTRPMGSGVKPVPGAERDPLFGQGHPRSIPAPHLGCKAV